MKLSLSTVAENPSIVTYSIDLHDAESVTLRPLEPGDVDDLADFLSGLSDETKRLSTFEGYDKSAAQKLCDSINKYDKLRFVVVPTNSNSIVGLIEFSFGLPNSDIERFHKLGYELNLDTDCRFGPTLADSYQNKKLGSKLMPLVIEIAKRFNKKRIILWGGVLKDNERAIKFYEKFGFKAVGEFSTDGLSKLDMILDLNKM